LFNYVNELSHEIEQLNETVQQLQDSIGTLWWWYNSIQFSLIN
jgi:hypothetical protein